MLFHHQLDPDNDPYVLSALLRLKPSIALSAFADALQKVVARHDVLRTVFLWQGLSASVQVVQREANLHVEALSLSANDSVRNQLNAMVVPIGQSMNISKAPLLSLGTYTDETTSEQYIVFKFHHLIFDHVGLEIIMKEIGEFLQPLSQSLRHSLSVSESAQLAQYREFIAQTHWQAQKVNSAEYFTALLKDVDEVTAPFALIDVHGETRHIIEESCVIHSELSTQIRQVAQQQGFSYFIPRLLCY